MKRAVPPDAVRLGPCDPNSLEPAPVPPPAGLARAGAITVGSSMLGLIFNVVTGVLIARSLGADGRGEYAALLTIPAVAVWVFSSGVQSAASFQVARRREDASRLLTTWLIIGAVLIGGGMIIVGALAPILVSAQDEHLVALLRLAVLSMISGFAFQLFSGILVGDEDYTFVNVLQFVGVGALTILILSLALTHTLTVTTALVANLAVYFLTAAYAGVRVIRRFGWARPDLELGKQNLWYGFRIHSNGAGGQITTRLDLFIMPAVIGASSIGQYAVAVNVSTIVASVASFLPVIILPAAVRGGPRGPRIIVGCTCAVLAIGIIAAVTIGVAAEVGVHLIYGDGFEDSVFPLRLLLVGTVALVGAQVLAAGLASLERPFTAGIALLPAVVITVIGLTLFLKSGGINAAAAVSTAAYLAYFATALVLYKHAAGLSVRELGPTRAECRHWWFRARARTATLKRVASS